MKLKIYSRNKWVSFQLPCQFAILIMTMTTPEDFRTLWTERFARNVLNGTYGTKGFENETDRFGNRKKHFENGMLLRCSSALQSLYPPQLIAWGIIIEATESEKSLPAVAK